MMALVMGTRSPSALARACELGVAMQLTNIARDVGEDARNGRLYLPADWLREEGLDPAAWLAEPQFTPAIARITQRLLRAADELYRKAELGIAQLPLDCRPAIQAARLVYAEIGHQLQREGLNSVDRRTVVSRRRKLALIAKATGTAFMPSFRSLQVEPPLHAIRYLVDSVERSLPPMSLQPGARLRRRSFDEAMERASQLHMRLLERDQQTLH
jgi:phytoene synthase